MTFRLYFSETKPRMAIFVSKMPHCLYDLLARYAAGEWHVEIPLIISNHPDLELVANRFDIPFHYFPINKENKAEQEAAILELLIIMVLHFAYWQGICKFFQKILSIIILTVSSISTIHSCRLSWVQNLIMQRMNVV
jgi:hypothetical protein